MHKSVIRCISPILPQQPNADLAVVDKFTMRSFCRVALADKQILDRAIAAAAEAATPMRRLALLATQSGAEASGSRAAGTSATNWPTYSSSKSASRFNTPEPRWRG